MTPKRLGQIHVYTGEGKGKTTAAMGLALRAIGQGLKVYTIQFLKGGAYTGEFISTKNFLPKEKTEIRQYGKRCVKEMKQYKLIGLNTSNKSGLNTGNKEESNKNEISNKGFEANYFDYIREDINCGKCRQCFVNDEEQKKLAREAFKHAQEILLSEEYDLIVLDEINNAVHYNYLSVYEVVELLQKKAPHIELVLTGRNAHQEIIAIADLVTEMKKIKHYFDDGILARRGIEY